MKSGSPARVFVVLLSVLAVATPAFLGIGAPGRSATTVPLDVAGPEPSAGSALPAVGPGVPTGVVATLNVSEPTGMTTDPGADALFVSSLTGRAVEAFSTVDGSLLARIPVGGLPASLVLDPSSGEVFAPLVYSNNVTVVSTTTDSVVGTVALAAPATTAVYSASTGMVFLAFGWPFGPGAPGVTEINGSTDRIEMSIPTGSPISRMVLDGPAGYLFALNVGGVNITDIYLAKAGVPGTTQVTDVRFHVVDAAVDPQNGSLYVVGYNRTGNVLSIIPNGSLTAVGPFPLPTNTSSAVGSAVAFDLRGTYFYVPYAGVDCPAQPAAVPAPAVGPEGTFSPCAASLTPLPGSLLVLDPRTLQIVSDATVGSAPGAPVESPSVQELYVANGASCSVTVLDPNGVVRGWIAVGAGPTDPTFDPDNQEVYVRNLAGNTVQGIGLTTTNASASPVGCPSTAAPTPWWTVVPWYIVAFGAVAALAVYTVGRWTYLALRDREPR